SVSTCTATCAAASRPPRQPPAGDARMANSGARLLTLALTTFAGWAAMAALVVWSGLGGRYTLHPDDPTLASPLPSVDLARAEARLGPIEEYAVVSDRPLFNADRLPLPDDGATEEEGAGEEVAPPAP